jgi:hypothetical protein
MAVVLANSDINVLAAEACIQENLPVDDLTVHSLNLSAQTGGGSPSVFGDTVKVPIYSATGAATTFAKGSNDYGDATAAQGVTYKDVVINARKKRTIEIDEMDLLRLDIGPLLRLETENVMRTMVADVNALIINANFATNIIVGAVGAFDADVVVGLRAEDQIRQYPTSLRKCILNTDYSIALQKDPVINNHNKLTPVDLGSNQILTSFAKFGGGLFEFEEIPTALNQVGFATNGCGIAIAMPMQYQNNDPQTFEQSMLNVNGFPFLMRRHKDKDTGSVFITIEAQYGFSVADEDGIVRLVSA